MKVLVVLSYWNRPRMVRNALQSLQENTYQNWQLAFCDDCSEFPGEATVCEMFSPEQIARTVFYNSNDREKRTRGVSTYGKMVNQAIRNSDADICVFLCDDDALQRDYLANLVAYYEQNPAVQYAQSHIILFNPLEETFDSIKERIQPDDYLKHVLPVAPVNSVDASQVSWRRSACTAGNCWFPEVQTSALDAAFFGHLNNAYGLCVSTGFVGQFKGWHNHQLGRTGSFEVVD